MSQAQFSIMDSLEKLLIIILRIICYIMILFLTLTLIVSSIFVTIAIANYSPILALTLTFLLSIILFSAALGQIKKRRIIESTPRAFIRSAAQGYNQIYGKIKPFLDPPLIAPLTKIPCAWYEYRISKDNDSNSNSDNEKNKEPKDKTKDKQKQNIIQSETSEAWILFDDGTGECFVDPKGLKVYPTQYSAWQGTTPMPESVPSEAHYSIAKKQKIMDNAHFFPGQGSYFYYEARLEFDNPLYIMGMFHTVDISDEHKNDMPIKEIAKKYPEILSTQKINVLSQDGLPEDLPWQISSISIDQMNYYKKVWTKVLLGFSIFYFVLGFLVLIIAKF